MARIYLKKPNQKRKSFSLYRQDINTDGSTKNVTLNSDEIDALNLQLKQQKISIDEAIKVAERIRLRYNIDIGAEEIPQSLLQANLDVLNKYWKYEYSDRYVRDEVAAKGKLRRAIESLGLVDISTASREEISSQIKSLEIAINVKRTHLQKLNQILRFLNRDIRLRMPKEENKDVTYLTDEEFNKVIDSIDDNYLKIAAKVTFYTGARSGEVMCLDINKLRGKSVFIDCQYLYDEKKFAETKTRRSRSAYIFNDGVAALDEWTKIKDYDMRIELISSRFKRACKKMFPNQPQKHCGLHGLRHSYAIKLVRFVGLTLTAQSIGDSIKVTEKYYTGFVLRQESIDMIDKLVNV